MAFWEVSELRSRELLLLGGAGGISAGVLSLMNLALYLTGTRLSGDFTITVSLMSLALIILHALGYVAGGSLLGSPEGKQAGFLLAVGYSLYAAAIILLAWNVRPESLVSGDSFALLAAFAVTSVASVAVLAGFTKALRYFSKTGSGVGKAGVLLQLLAPFLGAVCGFGFMYGYSALEQCVAVGAIAVSIGIAICGVALLGQYMGVEEEVAAFGEAGGESQFLAAEGGR